MVWLSGHFSLNADPAPFIAAVEVRPYSALVPDYFLVANAKGPAWDHSRGVREQEGWDEHAAFMDRLTEEGFVVLGGPIEGDDRLSALLIIDADDEATVRARLTDDPWSEQVLTIESVRPWSVWLRAPGS
jgi:uncharacterized protein YciI